MEFGYYLMIKQAVGHNMKYLCKCVDYKDPHKYKGSGIYWLRYIRKHKCQVVTTIIGHFPNKQTLREAGIKHSQELRVVEDPSWANLIEEIGDGGCTIKNRVKAYNIDTLEIRTFKSVEDIPPGWRRGTCPKGTHIKSKEAIEKTVKFHTGRKRSEQARENMRKATRRKRKVVPCNACNMCFTIQNLERHQKRCARATAER